jgi:REP element-mobilizing transposase RayT
MPRPLREQEPGATHHVTIHAIDEGTIVRTDIDRSELLNTLGMVVARKGWNCLAFCILDTHYHLLVTTPDANLAEGMQLLNGIYAQRFNRRHARRGHVFRERYRPRRVMTDAHVLLTVRYIALNPVRANIVETPAGHLWSSYAGLIEATKCWPFIARDQLLEHFGSSATATQVLRDFVEGSSPAESLHQPGSDPWGD